jgi:hypothetical protein
MAAFASWLGVMPAAKKVDLTCVRQADEFPPSVMAKSSSGRNGKDWRDVVRSLSKED